jgi:hypothetical protein
MGLFVTVRTSRTTAIRPSIPWSSMSGKPREALSVRPLIQMPSKALSPDGVWMLASFATIALNPLCASRIRTGPCESLRRRRRRPRLASGMMLLRNMDRL